MTRFALGPTRGPIGLAIDGCLVRAAQVSRGRSGKRVLTTATSFPRRSSESPTSGEILEIFGILERHGFRGSEVALWSGHAPVVSQFVDLPPRNSGAPIDQIARGELSRANRLDLSSFEMAMWDLPEIGGRSRGAGSQSMAVLLPHAEADRAVDAFVDTPLIVRSLEPLSTALARAVAPAIPAGVVLAVVLHVGWSASTLTVVNLEPVERRAIVVYERRLGEHGMDRLVSDSRAWRTGGMTAVRACLRRLSRDESPPSGPNFTDLRSRTTTYINALTMELERSLQFVQRRFAPLEATQCILAGMCEGVRGLSERIASHLGLSARAVTPLEVMEVDPAVHSIAGTPEMLLPLGLALGWGGEGM
ncbi:MAG: hypothetical protein AB7Q00_03710 [Phycisphaerales bacterium]